MSVIQGPNGGLIPGAWVTTTSPNTITPLTFGNQGVVSNQGGPFGAPATVRNHTNSLELKENEAYNTSTQTLCDLWLAKWGNEWVDLTAIHDDRFWQVACERLKQLGHVEQHYLTDRATYVCRKPE